ncbi:ribulose-phosphate 3-epimerase [Candidatus Woesearchaeota archaeon]|nr:MAG: ribulose-phosphate 3-epimerase [Candidatus Woesearchaeota archaeon]
MEIVPGILAKNLKELKEQLEAVHWAKKVHIDIMDGRFVPEKTIQLKELKKAFPESEVQIHLMAEKPESYIKKYARLGCHEFIIHSEATTLQERTLCEIKCTGMKAGIAFNPKTAISKHSSALKESDIALVMTVNPGAYGQRMLKTPLKKISQIRRISKRIKIGVDGGFNKKTCGLVSQQGADFAIATSSVTLADNPKKEYKELKKISSLSRP